MGESKTHLDIWTLRRVVGTAESSSKKRLRMFVSYFFVSFPSGFLGTKIHTGKKKYAFYAICLL
jgi:hypothetical protein